MKRVALVLVAFTLALPAGAPAREKSPVWIVPEAERPDRIAQVRDAIARYDSLSAYPLPPLTDDRMRDLMNGEVVRFREKQVLGNEGDKENERTRQRAFAFRLVDSPRTPVWLAAIDTHFVLNDRLTEVRLDADVQGTSTWYQFMDLPWPIRNRHWVIRVTKGADVTARTGGQAWEHSWSLVPDGEARARELAAAGGAAPLSVDDVRGARYLEANDGAWSLFALDAEHTLLAYSVTIVLGGWIPEGMASRFAMSALEDLLDRVAANAARVPAHYVSGHEPICAGDATPIPFFGASAEEVPAEAP